MQVVITLQRCIGRLVSCLAIVGILKLQQNRQGSIRDESSVISVVSSQDNGNVI